MTTAAETRMSHIVARVTAAPTVAPESLSCQVRDSIPPIQTKAPARSRGVMMRLWRIGVQWTRMGQLACCWA